MTDNNNTNNQRISRIRHRTGLKQDLPQPLAPGEIGLAVDSRQVYIGGDPSNPAAADYNSVSYFENTLSARDHTVSIANNQLIAFTVPFVKYSRGEYNGISTAKVWVPTDARSTIDGALRPECFYTSSQFPVFSPRITNPVAAQVSEATTNTAQIYVSSALADRIRPGDRVIGSGIVGTVTVLSISPRVGPGDFSVILSSTQTTTLGSFLVFIPNNLRNFMTGAPFVSTDVTVCKNGLKLIPEANSQLAIPSAIADYALSAASPEPVSEHVLTLRTRPSRSDQVTVCYYSNTSVIQAIAGNNINGKISPSSSIDSFYTQYNIPEWLHIPEQNIRVSTTSGLGYIGLEQKHIVAYATGQVIPSATGLSLGNLMISRDDVLYRVSVAEESNAAPGAFEVTFLDEDENIFSGHVGSDVYSYHAFRFANFGATRYLNNKLVKVNSVSGATANITIDPITFSTTRDGQANLASIVKYPNNGFTQFSPLQTIITISGNSTGIRPDDYVRILDNTGDPANCELHDAVVRVRSVVSNNEFEIDLADLYVGNANVDFTANISSVSYVNHGPVANIESTIQLVANHGIPLVNSQEVVSIYVDQANSILVPTQSYSIGSQVADLTNNTLFVTGLPSLPAAAGLSASGSFVPNLQASYTGSTLAVIPVLSIDLSANTSLTQVINTVNRSTVIVPSVSSQPIDIFPFMDFVPGSNQRAVYVTQDAGYSSVSAGGIPFTLYDDAGTLATLGLVSGSWSRRETVRARLEQWLNGLVVSRDLNLFTNVFIGGTPYADNVSNLQQYNLLINDTFGEISFCSREEAGNFNYVVNAAYSESVFDRREDDRDGTRGLVNLKNNLELQTREAIGYGEKVVSYYSLESAIITNSLQQVIFRLDLDEFDSFIIDYSLREVPGSTDRYARVGTLHVTARSDFDPTQTIMVNDTYHSTVERADPLVVGLIDPAFITEIVNNQIWFKLREQHDIQAQLLMRYSIRRWTSRF